MTLYVRLSESAEMLEQRSEAEQILWGWQGKIFRCFVAESKILRLTRSAYFNILWKHTLILVFLVS